MPPVPSPSPPPSSSSSDDDLEPDSLLEEPKLDKRRFPAEDVDRLSVTKEETEEEEEKEPPARLCYSSSSSDTEVNEDIVDFGSLVIEEAGSGSENSTSEGEEEAIMTAGRHRKKSRRRSSKEDSGGEERHQLTRPGSNYSQRSVSYFVDLGMENLQSDGCIHACNVRILGEAENATPPASSSDPPSFPAPAVAWPSPSLHAKRPHPHPIAAAAADRMTQSMFVEDFASSSSSCDRRTAADGGSQSSVSFYVDMAGPFSPANTRC